MSITDVADQLRACANQLDEFVGRVREHHPDSPVLADVPAPAPDARPPGVTPAGWESFQRGDNISAIASSDAAAIIAAGLVKQPDQQTPSDQPPAPLEAPTAPAPSDVTVTPPAEAPGLQPDTEAAQAAPEVDPADGSESAGNVVPAQAGLPEGAQVVPAPSPTANPVTGTEPGVQLPPAADPSTPA